MKSKILLLLIFLSFRSFSQDKFTLSGYLKDGKNGETLIGAIVSKQGTAIGVSTNEYGFYSLTLPKGKHIIALNYIGYLSQTMEINLEKNRAVIETKIIDPETQKVTTVGEANVMNVNVIR